LKRNGTMAITLGIMALLILAEPSWSLTIATFNMEYFSISGPRGYSRSERSLLAQKIEASGAEIVALQEIEGDETMRTFVSEDLPGWSYGGNDTQGKQDLYFIWKTDKIRSIKTPRPRMVDERINWKGSIHKLFQRPPLEGTFEEITTGTTFSAINVHLQSLGTRGNENRLEAVATNNGIRQAQILSLGVLSEGHDDPLFILGDFNTTEPTPAPFPTLKLEEGHSYDDLQCTIDHIGYVNISPESNWKLKELETSIPERSRAGRQHPDHDMVILSMPSFPDGSDL